MFGIEYFIYTIFGSWPSIFFGSNAADERLLLETRVQHTEIHNIDTALVYLYFTRLT